MKTLLIVSGGVEACHGIKRAKEMGLRVVCSDMDPQAPGFAIADDRIISSTYDAEATADAAARYVAETAPLDGVLTIGADVPLTVAAVAHRLKLPGISLESAKLAADKLAMKRRFAECGVPVPWFAEVSDTDEVGRLWKQRGGDLVIKPADSRGSRGVQRLSQVKDLVSAFELARVHSPTRQVMVEEYLDGPQVSTESIVSNGHCDTPGFSDRNYEYLARYAPFFIENGGDMPSRLDAAIQVKVRDTVAAAAKAMGIDNGTVKGDIVVHDGKVYVIELAARLSGGYFCTREIPLNTGVDFIGAAVRIALGETVAAQEASPKFQHCVTQRYAFPPPGRVLRISGVDKARRIPGIEEVLITARIGDILRHPTDSNCSAAMVLACGKTREETLSTAEAAIAALDIETVPL
jgi:biotin carboxylase